MTAPTAKRSLGRESTPASPRVRVLDAMARVVTDHGYETTTVADIVREARVSRRTFYEHFADKQDCFGQGCWHGIALLFGAIADAEQELPAPWRDELYDGLASVLRALAAYPDYAWILVIESGSVRPAQEARSAVVEQWVDLWGTICETVVEQETNAVLLPRSTYRGLVGGIEALVRKCLVERGATRLPEIIDDAAAFAVAVVESALRR